MATLVWTDNFESYPPGSNTITTPWVNTGPAGPSFPDSIISTAIYHSPTQSLGVGINGGTAEGAGWVIRSFNEELSVITVDLWVYMPVGTDIPDPPEPNGPGFILQNATSGGQLNFWMGGLGTCYISQKVATPGTDAWFSFSLSLGEWHHIRWATTLSATGSSSCSVDGADAMTFSGDTRTNAFDTTVDEINCLGQFIVASPPVEIFFDDISIYNGIYTPVSPPGALTCGLLHSATQINPTWANTSDAPYTLQYRIDGTSAWTEIPNIPGTSYVITGLLPGTEYEWQVAGNSTGFSSSQFCFTDAAAFTFLSCQNGWTVTQPVVQIWGFDHLIGMTVTGLIDGIVMQPQVVAADGSIILPFPSTNVKSGLSFLPQLQTPRLDAGSPTVQGRRKAVSALTARINKSGPVQMGTNQIDGSTTTPQSVGPVWTNMTTAPLQPQQGTQPQSSLTYLSPSGQVVTMLQTGDVRTTVNDSWAKPGQLALQQPLPQPLEVMAVMPELIEGDITEQGYSQEQKPEQHPDHRRQHQGPGAWMLRR